MIITSSDQRRFMGTALAAGLLCLSQISVAAEGRDRQRFDSDWRFQLDKSTTTTVSSAIQTWQWKPISDKVDTESPTLPSLDLPGANPAFSTVKYGGDVFNGRTGFCLFETVITPTKSRPTVLRFESVDDNATVYVNGKRVLHHDGWSDPFDVPLGNVKAGEPIKIDVIVENTAGPGGIGATVLTGMTDVDSPKEAGVSFSDSNWRTVHLPHDYVIEGTFAESADAGHGALPRSVAWYRKSFTLPKSAKGKSVWIDFDGAFSDAHVWLNGRPLGSHRSGYTGFRFDISSAANFGADNVLAVRLDARKTEGWWYEGGGLYRHVWLTVTNPIHVAPLGGVFVTSSVPNPLAKSPEATVHVATQLDNESGRAQDIRVVEDLLGPSGSAVAKATISLKVGVGANQIKTAIRFSKAQLWSLEHTNLYTLRTSVFAGSKKLDDVTTPFGIRTVRWDANLGFMLNEKPVKLKGTCNHQDFIAVGIGMPDSILDWRIKKLKEMGSNAYRCSHNEVAPELLDACDRQGMLVMDENREFGDTFSGKASEKTTTNDLSDLTQEVLRDRNHPSVFVWSIANEEFSVQGTPGGARIARVLAKRVHELDPTRLVTAALNGGHDSYMSHELDIEGYNYGGPWDFDKFHKAHPDHPLFGSETASATTTRSEYADDKVRGYVKAYNHTAQDAWAPIAERPFNAGGFVWTGFDYKGEPSPYSWPCVNSHFGIMDMCGFPKDDYFYYKAWWGDKPIVHVLPHWNWAGKEGQPIQVWVFGNGDSVELFLNGKSLGVKTMPKYHHLEWTVPYEPGTLSAKSYTDGKTIATDQVVTTGAAVALRVTTLNKNLSANNEDCAMLEVSLVDANGRVVPTASDLVTFSVSGPAVVAGVGNGDPSSHEPDRASQRHAFHGLCMGVIQAKDRKGVAKVTITAPGLKSTTISLPIQAGSDR